MTIKKASPDGEAFSKGSVYAEKHGNDETGQEIGYLDPLSEKQVDAYSEDERVPDQRQVSEHDGSEKRSDERCEQRHRPLEHEERNDGEDDTFAHSGCERHDDDAVKNAFGDEQRHIVVQCIIDRPDDGHGPDADGE